MKQSLIMNFEPSLSHVNIFFLDQIKALLDNPST